MMNTRNFLDAVKRRHHLTSDYQLAQLLGWRTQRISMYRHTARELDEAGCIAIADALGVPAGYVLAEIASVRAKTDAARKEWARVARLLKAGSKAAAACLVGAVLVGSHDARATTDTPAHFSISQSIHYAHLLIRRALAWLACGKRAFCDSVA